MPHAAGLYYEEHGPADAPPLLLSSGLGGSASYWQPNIPAFAERFRVIAYDHRGTGRSDRSPLERLALSDLGADMIALLDALGIERAHVVGHAIGGMAALEAARAARERVGRIVLVNGWAQLDPQTARCFETRLTLLRSAGVEAYLTAQPIFLFPPTYLSEHDAELSREQAHHLANWPGDTVMEQRIAAAAAFDCTPWANEIASPVLLVNADDDLLVPWTRSIDLRNRLPDAIAMPMFWGGHAVNVTDPDNFNQDVIAWLAGEPVSEE